MSCLQEGFSFKLGTILAEIAFSFGILALLILILVLLFRPWSKR